MDDTSQLPVCSKTDELIPAKPFLHWVGGKKQLIDEIRKQYPAELGKAITKYAEPFVGGGSVLFDVLNIYKMKEVYISDANAELIHVYKTIRDSPQELLQVLKHHEFSYLTASDAVRKDQYYNNRNRYNEMMLNKTETPELAGLFITLNKTCYNGLYRVNSKGEYNTPHGRRKNPTICDENNILAVSQVLQNVEISSGDYKRSSKFIDCNTFVYIDPPYRPLTKTSNYTSYTQNKFNDNDQIELARYIDKMSDKGAYILACNSDPKNKDKNDTFFDSLYSRHNIYRVYARRSINSDGAKRGKISELLIATYDIERK